MKQDGAPDVDVTKAVAELKARKRTLEAKVNQSSPMWNPPSLHLQSNWYLLLVKYTLLSESHMQVLSQVYSTVLKEVQL